MSTASVVPIRTQSSTARADIATAVRAHLAVARLSDSALARKIGMSQPAMSRRTNEEVPFDADDLGRIADALGLTVVELIQMPRSPRPEVAPSDYKSGNSGDVVHVDFTRRTVGQVAMYEMARID